MYQSHGTIPAHAYVNFTICAICGECRMHRERKGWIHNSKQYYLNGGEPLYPVYRELIK